MAREIKNLSDVRELVKSVCVLNTVTKEAETGFFRIVTMSKERTINALRAYGFQIEHCDLVNWWGESHVIIASIPAN